MSVSAVNNTSTTAVKEWTSPLRAILDIINKIRAGANLSAQELRHSIEQMKLIQKDVVDLTGSLYGRKGTAQLEVALLGGIMSLCIPFISNQAAQDVTKYATNSIIPNCVPIATAGHDAELAASQSKNQLIINEISSKTNGTNDPLKDQVRDLESTILRMYGQ